MALLLHFSTSRLIILSIIDISLGNTMAKLLIMLLFTLQHTIDASNLLSGKYLINH